MHSQAMASCFHGIPGPATPSAIKLRESQSGRRADWHGGEGRNGWAKVARKARAFPFSLTVYNGMGHTRTGVYLE
jgi:hypothetical protein